MTSAGVTLPRLDARRSTVLFALSGCLTWLLIEPRVADLAAQTARAHLFTRAGFTVWWGGWFSGVHTVAYSLLSPPLMAYLGVGVVGVLSVMVVAWLAPRLTKDTLRPKLGAWAVTAAALCNLASGRITFGLGLAFAVMTLAGVSSRRRVLAPIGGIAATLASPVAGLFVVAIMAGVWWADPSRRRMSVEVAVATGVPMVAISLMFPGGGRQPFSAVTFWVALVATACVALSTNRPMVRRVAIMAGLMLVAAFVVPTPLGSNAARLSLLFAAPAIIAEASSAWLLVALALPTGIWTLENAVGDVHTSRDPGAKSSYYAPLVTALQALSLSPGQRVEVVDPRNHWSSELLPEAGFPIARGWERQIDVAQTPMFYDAESLSAASYRAFLDANSVAVVALPHGTPLDPSAVQEARLVDAGLSYLTPEATAGGWTIYRVTKPAPPIRGVASITAYSDTKMLLHASSSG